MQQSTKHIPAGLVTGYILSILLVPLYVQMYPVWRLLNDTLPPLVMKTLPIVVTIILLCAILLAYRSFQKRERRSLRTWAVLAGVLLCLAALALPDPGVPVKRIHVAEYLILSVLVRLAMSYRLQGLALLIFSGIFTALLGIHDEFLQGFHPARTYGLRDMAVNGLSGFGGALIWHGLDLFKQDVRIAGSRVHRTTESVLYLFWLTLSVLALVWPLAYYRASLVPLWPAAPLLGSLAFYLLSKKYFFSPWKHGMTTVSLTVFVMGVYPLLGNVWPLVFY